MYTCLAIALDGSPQAEKALPVGIRLAKALPARLLLLHLCMEPKESGDTWLRDAEVEEALKPEKYLEHIKHTLTNPSKSWSLPPDQVQTKVQYNKFAYELGDVATTEGADLLLMTTHGRSGLSLLMLGSIATGVLKHSRQPVLLMQPAETAASLEEVLETVTQSQPQILVTLDASPKAEAALEPAMALAEQLKGTLHLVEVVTPTPPVIMAEPGIDFQFLVEMAREQEEEQNQDAFKYLEKVKEWVKGKAPQVEVEITVLDGFPAPQLEAYIRETKPFLLVMATHARNEFGQILLGSVAEEILRQGHLPVLMVPIPRNFKGYGLIQPAKDKDKTEKKPVATAKK